MTGSRASPTVPINAHLMDVFQYKGPNSGLPLLVLLCYISSGAELYISIVSIDLDMNMKGNNIDHIESLPLGQNIM